MSFARLPFQVYDRRDAWWPPDIQNEIDLLSRRSLLSSHLEVTPFCARRGGRAVARVSAVINRRYIEHWNEQLGQLIQFEALEGEDIAVAAMLDEACDRCANAGCVQCGALRGVSRLSICDRQLRAVAVVPCCAEIRRRTIATSRRRAS